MPKQLERLSVRIADKGGYIVQHSYKAQPVKRGGAMRGGISMEYQEPEEVVFGKDEAHKLLSHIARELKMGKVAAIETAEDEAGEE